MLAAGSTIKGEVTTARALPAAKGRRKLQAFCAEGEVILVTGLRRKVEVRSGRALHTPKKELDLIFF